jgi:hypothetical protein
VPGNLNMPVLQALVRPYPKLIAGTPSSWSYAATIGTFTLRYATRPVGGGTFGPGVDTEVELPALRYPTGYSVTVNGARIISAPDTNLLILANQSGAQSVEVSVAPAEHHPRAPGPFTWPAGAAAAMTADCPSGARPRVRVSPPGSWRRIARVLVSVDSQQVASVRPAPSIALPAGLADGSVIQLTARTAAGHPVSTTRDVQRCALSPTSTWTVG